jgi:hypothetical protein
VCKSSSSKLVGAVKASFFWGVKWKHGSPDRWTRASKTAPSSSQHTVYDPKAL